MKNNIMKPSQPYFVLETEGFRQKIYLKNGISHFYTFRTSSDRDIVLAVPDGCIDLLFQYDNTGMHAFVCGTVLSHQQALQNYTAEYFGVRFMPGVHPFMIDLKMKELVGMKISLCDVIMDKSFIEYLSEQVTFGDRINVFLQAYLKSCPTYQTLGTKKQIAMVVKDAIYETMGNIKVQELETFTGYSARYLDKIFTEEMGYSPKTFCKIIQFQKTLEYLKEESILKLTDLAVELGYYDQAKLTKDFKQFANITPKQYQRRVTPLPLL